MARGGEVALDQDLVVAEGGAGFALGQSEGLGELGGRFDDAHAFAATAGADALMRTG